MADHPEMRRTMAWPFDGEAFPGELGAVVQRTVLDGQLPALVVGHADDGDWYVGDGVNDPNVPGACVATHIAHAVQRDRSIAPLATMPPGHEARRSSMDTPWQIEVAELAD